MIKDLINRGNDVLTLCTFQDLLPGGGDKRFGQPRLSVRHPGDNGTIDAFLLQQVDLRMAERIPPLAPLDLSSESLALPMNSPR